MTKLLELAMVRAQRLPPELQDEIARLVMAYAGDDRPVLRLTAEEHADLAEADAEIARQDFAPDEEVAAIFAKYSL